MSKVSIQGNASGTGTLTIAAPNTNSNYQLDLPTAAGTIQVSGNPISGTTGTFSSTISGASTIGVGGATPSASGAGITFPATQSASSDANTLDDYEEGTWTPTVTSQSGTITSYTTSNSSYTKIGNIVRFNCSIAITNAGTGAGTMKITLPFSPVDTSWAASGAEVAAVGYVCSVFGDTAGMGLRKYENSTAIVTNHQFRIAGVFQV